MRLEFTLEPEDRETLMEVQEWIDKQREAHKWTPLAGWKPEDQKPGKQDGTITYRTPIGWVDDIPVADFRRMKTGKLGWALPIPRPSAKKMREMADKLANLHFQDSVCRLCNQPLKDEDGPEMAQIHKLLEGRFVLPYINHPLAPGQKELRFRRLHLLHSVWEERLVTIELERDDLSDEELVEALLTAAPEVLADARKRQPRTTEEDVMKSLDEVLAYWEELDG
ncbi:MAG: hypothetical protein B7X10_06700 [Burkholderiales bacterium 21-58-4]|nr:MAG: hypothetical protein B7X10_06700 [Burkholderiales bacterium 21-58-4]